MGEPTLAYALHLNLSKHRTTQLVAPGTSSRHGCSFRYWNARRGTLHHGEGQETAFVASVHAKAIALIKLALDMTTAAGSGHPTSAASLAHLITLLMSNHMRYDP